MDLQSGKRPSSDQDHQQRKDPEIQAQHGPLPEPPAGDERIPVSGYDIVHGIELEDGHPKLSEMHVVEIPHDRSHPDADLQADRDDLCQIPEEDHDRARKAGHPVDHRKHAERIVRHLYDRDARKMSLFCG